MHTGALLQHAVLTEAVVSGRQALEEAKNRDRLYIPSRYQLFTLNQVRQVCDTGNDHPPESHMPVALITHNCPVLGGDALPVLLAHADCRKCCAVKRPRIVWQPCVQAVRAAEEAATHAEGAAQAAEAGGNAVEATSKAALASLRCSQVRPPSPPPRHGVGRACSPCSSGPKPRLRHASAVNNRLHSWHGTSS